MGGGAPKGERKATRQTNTLPGESRVGGAGLKRSLEGGQGGAHLKKGWSKNGAGIQ